MDHPYSFWADVLSKYQGSPPWIQALSLMLLAGVTVAVAWCVADVVKHAVTGVRRRRRGAGLVYGVVQDADGRWLVCIEREATRWRGRAPAGTGRRLKAGRLRPRCCRGVFERPLSEAETR